MADRAALPPEFTNKVLLRCEAKVGGEQLVVQQEVVQAVYDSSADFRKMVHKALREALMYKILEKWTPKIKIEFIR